MLDTNQVIEVTKNVAFGLVDSGKAELYKETSKTFYPTRQMTSQPEQVEVSVDNQANKFKAKKGYKIK